MSPKLSKLILCCCEPIFSIRNVIKGLTKEICIYKKVVIFHSSVAWTDIRMNGKSDIMQDMVWALSVKSFSRYECEEWGSPLGTIIIIIFTFIIIMIVIIIQPWPEGPARWERWGCYWQTVSPQCTMFTLFSIFLRATEQAQIYFDIWVLVSHFKIWFTSG